MKPCSGSRPDSTASLLAARRAPPWIVADQYQWRWLYLARAPHSGDSFTLLLPGTDDACLQVFVDTWATQFSRHERIRGFWTTGHPSRPSRALASAAGPCALADVFPGLNPVERCFQELQAHFANRIRADITKLDDALTAVLQEYWHNPTRLGQLTGYPWWLAGTEAIQPPA